MHVGGGTHGDKADKFQKDELANNAVLVRYAPVVPITNNKENNQTLRVQENTRYAVQQCPYIHSEEGVEKTLYTITITIAQPLNAASSSLHVTVTQNPTPENTIHASGLSEHKLPDSHRK